MNGDDKALAETAALDETAASTTFASAPPHELAPGHRLDRYVIEGKLGAGAMGVVYAARDPELERPVAIKLLKPRHVDDALTLRLQREAQALARVSHPNVVAVHDVGTHDGDVFIAMELVRGETLRAWLARGQPIETILERLVEAGRGLAAVHEAGLVHRDFKPDNVLVGDDGRARVTDFGLARLDDDDDLPAAEANAGSPLSVELTRTGTMLGTPVYAAPEQLRGARVDGRADVFAFCATAYEALYGVRPFAGETIPQLLESARRSKVTPPKRSRRVASRVHAALVRGLAYEPAARTATVGEVIAAFAPRKRRAGIPIVVVVAALAITVAIVVFATRPSAKTCDALAELRGVWDEAISARARFVGDAVQSRARMDQYARRWTDLREQVCVEDRPRVKEWRTSCLDLAKSQLLVLGREFAKRDIDDATFLVLTETNLVHIDSCKDWYGDSPLQPADDKFANVSKARQQMIEARMALTLGRIEEARTVARELVDFDFIPVRAEVAALEADIALHRGDLDAAVGHLRRAIAIAEGASYDRVKSESATKLAEVLAKLGKLDEAAAMLDLAEAMVRRGGGDILIAIGNANTRARIADMRGFTDDAIRMYRATITKYGGPNAPVQLVLAQQDLYTIFIRLGRNAEALEMQAAIAAVMKANKVPLEGFDDQCQPTLLAGQIARAVEVCRAELMKREGGEQHALAIASSSYAIALEVAGDGAAARDAYLRSAGIHEQANRAADAAFALENAARNTLELGDFTRAVLLLSRSVELAKTNPEQLMFSSAALGRAYIGAGKFLEAIAVIEPVIPQLEAAKAWNALCSARLALAQGRWFRGGAGDRDRAREQAKTGKEDALRWRDKFDDVGLNAFYRRRMDAVIKRIDDWLATR